MRKIWRGGKCEVDRVNINGGRRAGNKKESMA